MNSENRMQTETVKKHQAPSLSYRLRRGLSKPEYTFDYRDLHREIVAWATPNNGIKQLTLTWFD